MRYENEAIAAALGAARVAKGFSQRALSEASGVPQAQISRIEKGVVDLRLSSLVAIARALDLELTLIPRKALPAVRSVVRSSDAAAGDQGVQARKALQSLQRTVAALQDQARDQPEFAQLQRQMREIRNLRLSVHQVEAVKKLRKDLAALRDGAARPDALHRALAQIEALRNAAAHASEAPVVSSSARPAYTLDEDENGDA